MAIKEVDTWLGLLTFFVFVPNAGLALVLMRFDVAAFAMATAAFLTSLLNHRPGEDQ